jgi:hypothetical protein
MTSADIHSKRFLLGLEISENPWAEAPAVQAPEGAFAAAGVHCAAGLWGAFLATAMWWSYAFVTTAQPVLMVAQAN